MGVRVNMFLRAQETSVGFHLKTEVEIECFCLGSCGFIVFSVDGELRVISVLHPAAGIAAVEFIVDIRFVPLFVQVFHTPIFTGEIHHRTRSVVLGLHIESRHAGCVCHFLVIGTEGRRDVYDTCTVFRRDIVARDHTECSFARINPREKRFVFKTHEVGAFVAGNDLRLYGFAFFIHAAQIFLISRETSFRKDNMVAGRCFYLYVVDFRTDTKSRIARQRPRSRRPSDDITTVFQVELGRTCQVFYIAITTRLIQLMATQSRSCGR